MVLTAVACVFILPLHFVILLALAVGLAGAALVVGRELVLLCTPTSVLGLELGPSGTLQVLQKDGGRLGVVVAPDSTIFPFFVVLRFRANGERLCRSIVISQDSTSTDALRRLRVWLKWFPPGRANGDVVA
ncbi:MAG: hypothetical protein WBP72_11420 [Rhodocyclaceae bacterium]